MTVTMVKAAGIVVMASTAATSILGCSHQPVSAASMLRADGYSFACAPTPPGDLTQYVTSVAAGFKLNGDAEVILMFTPQAASIIQQNSGLPQLQNDVPGSAVSQSGSVVRVDIPAAAVAADGGLGCPG